MVTLYNSYPIANLTASIVPSVTMKRKADHISDSTVHVTTTTTTHNDLKKKKKRRTSLQSKTFVRNNGNTTHITTTTTTTASTDSSNSLVNKLPEHIVCLILSFFSPVDLVKRISPLCRQLYNLSRRNVLWGRIDFKGFKVHSMPQAIDFISDLFGPNAENLNGTVVLPADCKNLSAASFQKLRKVYPRLVGLEIAPSQSDSASSSISNAGLRQIAALPNLQKIVIPNQNKITDEGFDFFTQQATSLSSVNIEHCSKLTMASVKSLLDRCGSKLKFLSITGNGNFTLNDAELVLLAEKAPNLEELRVDFGNVSMKAIEALCNRCGGSIRSLFVRGYPTLDAPALELLCSKLYRMQKLTIICSDGVRLVLPKIESQSLQEFQLSRTNAMIKANFFYCPQLNKFHVEDSRDFSSLEMKDCQNLTALTIRGCTIKGVNITSLLAKARKLRDLELVNCSLDCARIEIKSPNLEKAVIFMCRNVSEISLECDKLAVLNLDACVDLTKVDIKCPRLEQFRFFRLLAAANNNNNNNNNNVKQPKLRFFNIQSEKLTSLNMQCCANLESVSIDCPMLDALNMTGCKNLASLNLLSCPKLDKLALGSSSLDFSALTSSLTKVDDHECCNSSEVGATATTATVMMDTQVPFAVKLAQACPNVSMFSVSNAEKLDDQSLMQLCSNWKHLQALVISNCPLLTTPMLASPNLKGIQITDCARLERLLVDNTAMSLNKLYLRNCASLSDDALEQLSGTLSLKFIEVRECHKIQNPKCLFPELQELHFTQCNGLQHPSVACPNLQKLFFLNNEKLRDIDFAHKPQPQPQPQQQQQQQPTTTTTSNNNNNKNNNANVATCEVLFSDCPSVSDELVSNLGKMFGPNDNNGIKAVVFSNCPGLKAPRFCFSDFAHLKMLKFLECQSLICPRIELTDDSATTTKEAAAADFSVSIYNCNQFSFEAAGSFLRVPTDSFELVNCPSVRKICFDAQTQVRKIHVSQCNNVQQIQVSSDSVVKIKITACARLSSLALHSKRMLELAVSNCNDLSSLSLAPVQQLQLQQPTPIITSPSPSTPPPPPPPPPPQLRSVQIANCPRISDYHIAELTFKCKDSLRSLSVSNCGLSSPVIRHPYLTSLSVSSCTAMVRIIVECEKLAHLAITHCPKLTGTTSSVLSVNEQCGSLDCLASLDLSSTPVAQLALEAVLARAANLTTVNINNSSRHLSAQRKAVAAAVSNLENPACAIIM